jgi:hypothetical protein
VLHRIALAVVSEWYQEAMDYASWVPLRTTSATRIREAETLVYLRQRGDHDRDVQHDHQVADEDDNEHGCAMGGGAVQVARLHGPRSGLVLFVGDLLHPVDGLAVECLLNGDVGHRRGRRGAVPVFLIGLEPDYISRVDFLDRSTLALYQAAARRDDEDLAKGMDVPCRASAGLEGHRVAGRPRRSGRSEQGVDPYRASEPFGRALPEGWEPIRFISIFLLLGRCRTVSDRSSSRSFRSTGPLAL